MAAFSRGRASRHAPAQRFPEAMSTEDFLRNVVFAKRPRPEQQATTPGNATPGARATASPAAPPAPASSLPAPGAGSPAAAPSGELPPVLDCQCAFSPDGRLRAKQERCGGRVTTYDYAHDERGHLTEVRRDGEVAERYAYNAAGQRTEARVAPLPGMSRDALRTMETERAFAYDAAGRLVRAGRARYMYAPDGTLRCREEGRTSTWFYYGNGGNGGNGGNADAGGSPHAPHGELAPVALDSVVLPGGDIIRYRFGRHGMPFMVLRNDAPSEEYQWLDPLRLARFRDHRTGSDYTFHYGGDRVPEAVTVHGPALDNLEGGLLDLSIFRKDGEAAPPPRSVTFRIGRDQVGTVKALMDPDGKVVKRLEHDSFGNPLLDTCPYFFLPLGFAGGLVDRHTGLVRFGFRDYDPRTGRFTAPDPLGDTGGDHDPYDYCVDDPVSAFDPLGLIGEAIVNRGWDESKHPRDDIGRFTFADASGRGGSGNGTAAENSTQHAPTAGDGQAKDNISTKAHETSQPLRPWWSYPYDSKEKQEGIAKMQDALEPELSKWGNIMLDIGKATPNGQQIVIERRIDDIKNKLKNDKEKKLQKNPKDKTNN